MKLKLLYNSALPNFYGVLLGRSSKTNIVLRFAEDIKTFYLIRPYPRDSYDYRDVHLRKL